LTSRFTVTPLCGRPACSIPDHSHWLQIHLRHCRCNLSEERYRRLACKVSRPSAGITLVAVLELADGILLFTGWMTVRTELCLHHSNGFHRSPVIFNGISLRSETQMNCFRRVRIHFCHHGPTHPS
jgi:hypothetical protein